MGTKERGSALSTPGRGGGAARHSDAMAETAETQKGRKGRRGTAPGPVRKGREFWEGIWGAAPCPVGGNDSPRTPSIATQKGVRGRGSLVGWRQSGGAEVIRNPKIGRLGPEGAVPGKKGSAGAVRAAQSVQVCPFGPTCGGRPLLPLRGISGIKEGISRWLG